MINVRLFIVIFVMTFCICQLVRMICDRKKRDGRIVIDDVTGSWTISITTNPEEIKHKKKITLHIERR